MRYGRWNSERENKKEAVNATWVFMYVILSALQTVLKIGNTVLVLSLRLDLLVFCLSRLFSFLGVPFEGLSCFSQL